MPVNTPCAAYAERSKHWRRCRDITSDSDTVKAGGYIHMLAAHRDGGVEGQAAYQRYVDEALFFGASGRTVQALAGAVHQRPPVTVELPTMEGLAEDISLSGRTLEALALAVTTEQLRVGRVGLLVDWSESARRPYVAMYDAEAIWSWRTERRDGDEVLVLVVLAEQASTVDPADPFVTRTEQQFRVFSLVDGECVRSLWREERGDSGQRTGTWRQVESTTPTRRGQPLTAIPFVVANVTHCEAEPEQPPLLDLVDANCAHLRNSARLAHGLGFLGSPQLVITGQAAPDPNQPDYKPLYYGAGGAIFLPNPAAKAEIIQADGQRMGALMVEDERLRKLMAVLGARLLEEPASVQETATAVEMRQAGGHATLRTIASTGSQALTAAWRWCAWWLDTGDTAPEQQPVSITLAKDFARVKATPDEIRALVELLQDSRISEATFYHHLFAGGWGRDGVTPEEEREQIAEDKRVSEEASAARANARQRKALADAVGADDDPDADGDGADEDAA